MERSLDGERELFSVQELVKSFRPGDVGRSGAVFDLDKLRWLAGEYIRADSPEHLAERCLPFVTQVPQAELRNRWDWFVAVVRSEQQRISTYAELPPRIAYLFAGDDEVEYSDSALAPLRKQPDALGVLESYTAWLVERPQSDAASLREASRVFTEERGLKFSALMQPLRLALTGLSGGPDLFEIMELLGRDATLARLRSAPARLRAALR
jgi:glutamyl-tRNA synthetase